MKHCWVAPVTPGELVRAREGAWIETHKNLSPFDLKNKFAPARARGLKLPCGFVISKHCHVRAREGAWIETRNLAWHLRAHWFAPARARGLKL